MHIEFTDQVAIVTGAARGLGRCHALELARRGAKVVVNDFGGAVDGISDPTTQPAQAVVDEIESFGGTAIASADSVTDADAMQILAKSVMERWGRIDILVNNAGNLRDKSFAKMSPEDFALVVQVHLLGSTYATQAVWPFMKASQYGRIVFTSSGSGLWGNFGQANYSAAKMGMIGLMNTLKLEGGRNNIRLNALAPIATSRMTLDLMTEEAQQVFLPELVTPGVIYLCSESAPSGIILQTGGGKYSVVRIVENAEVDLGREVTAEDVAERFQEIAEFSGSKPRNPEITGVPQG